jgi:hypothetical protein
MNLIVLRTRSAFFLIGFFLLAGCSTLNHSKAGSGNLPLTDSSFFLLNGEYEIISRDTSHIMLDYCLTGIQKFDLVNRPDSGNRIRLETLPGRRLLVTVLSGNLSIRRKKIKGNLKDGYYMFKLRILRPYVVFNFFNEQEVRLSLASNKSLIVELVGTTTFFVLFVPVTGAKVEEQSLEFKKVHLKG